MTTTCTWIGPHNEGCQHLALEGKSYCAEHYALVYQEGTARARRHTDIRVANQVWDIESEFNTAVQELMDEGYDFAEDRWPVEVVED